MNYDINFDAIQRELGLSDGIMSLLKRPESVDEVVRAGYATVSHFTQYEGAHNWLTPLHGTTVQDRGECAWCGATRFDVRYGHVHHRCGKRPKELDRSIGEIIRDEEQRFARLRKRGQYEIPKLIAKLGVSGPTLAHIHQTYGYDFETMDSISGPFPVGMHDEYEKAYQEHVAISQSAYKPRMIVAR